MKTLCLSLLLILPAYAGFSQTYSGGKLCFTPAQAARLADSVRVLPLVRREALSWQLAATSYQQAADSAQAATAAQRDANRRLVAALQDERLLTANETALAARWQKRARRRGLLNWLGVLGIGAAGTLLLTR